jgi:hypothetical protein
MLRALLSWTGRCLVLAWVVAMGCRGGVIDEPEKPDAAEADASDDRTSSDGSFDAATQCTNVEASPVDLERNCISKQRVVLPCDDPSCRCRGLQLMQGCIARAFDGGTEAYLIGHNDSKLPAGFTHCGEELYAAISQMPTCP